MRRDDILGAWRLVSYTAERDGEVSSPLAWIHRSDGGWQLRSVMCVEAVCGRG
jgi:hypothetical protein